MFHLVGYYVFRRVVLLRLPSPSIYLFFRRWKDRRHGNVCVGYYSFSKHVLIWWADSVIAIDGAFRLQISMLDVRLGICDRQLQWLWLVVIPEVWNFVISRELMHLGVYACRLLCQIAVCSVIISLNIASCFLKHWLFRGFVGQGTVRSNEKFAERETSEVEID